MRERDTNIAKEVVNMKPAVLLREDETVYIREMDLYIAKLRKQLDSSKIKAREDARQALLRTGVITNDGKTKENIVSWE